MERMVVFGDNKQWGISVDDHCLCFHPNLHDRPKDKAKLIWKAAWEKVDSMGGFDAAVSMLEGVENAD